MRKAILVVGMRGAGKSTYCQKAKRLHPEINLISRDEYYVTHFSDCVFEPYTGTGAWAAELFWRHVGEVIEQYKGVVLIDAFTGRASERRRIIADLYKHGAEEVVCWFIDCSLDRCVQQFVERQYDPESVWESKRDLEARCRSDWKLFRKNVEDIFPNCDDDAVSESQVPNSWLDPFNDYDRCKFHFDGIVVIDPDQETLPGMPLI